MNCNFCAILYAQRIGLNELLSYSAEGLINGSLRHACINADDES